MYNFISEFTSFIMTQLCGYTKQWSDDVIPMLVHAKKGIGNKFIHSQAKELRTVCIFIDAYSYQLLFF